MRRRPIASGCRPTECVTAFPAYPKGKSRLVSYSDGPPSCEIPQGRCKQLPVEPPPRAMPRTRKQRKACSASRQKKRRSRLACAQIEVDGKNSLRGLQLVEPTAPYQLSPLGNAPNSCLYPVYVRAMAYL